MQCKEFSYYTMVLLIRQAIQTRFSCFMTSSQQCQRFFP